MNNVDALFCYPVNAMTIERREDDLVYSIQAEEMQED